MARLIQPRRAAPSSNPSWRPAGTVSCLALMLAAHPATGWSKDLNLTYTMALPTGASQVSVVNSNSPPTIQEYLLLNLDKDLRGQVTVDRISVSTVGTQNSPRAYYDIELYLTGQILPLSTQQFSTAQNHPLLTTPVDYRFVLYQPAPGAFTATGCYDYVGSALCAPVDVVRGVERNVLNTVTNGLTAAIFSWSGSPYTAFDISQVTFSFSGKIDNYQITPGLLKKTPVGIPAGDTAFNALSFVSADALLIEGSFTNRAIAIFDNRAELTVKGSFDNLGQLKNGVAIINNGTFRNASTSTLEVSGFFFNGDQSGGSGVFENAGTVNVSGSSGLFLSGSGASFSNARRLIVNNAALGVAVDLGGTTTNLASGSIEVQQGVMQTGTGSNTLNRGAIFIRPAGGLTTGGQFTTSGVMSNSGLLTNKGVLRAVAGGSLSTNGLENLGTLNNLTGAVLSLQEAPLLNLGELSNAGTVQFNGTAGVNAPAGTIRNAGTWSLLATSAFVNQGKFYNNQSGRVTLAAQTTFENPGNFINNGGAVFQTAAFSLVNNSGSFTNNGGQVLIGGDFVSSGGYNQFGGSTVVNGSLTGNITLIGGDLSGAANMTGNVTGRDVHLVPGNGPGTAPPRAAAGDDAVRSRSPDVVTIDGDLALEDSVIDIGISAEDSAHLDVSGTASFVQTQVRFVLKNGFQSTPQAGDFQFNWLFAGAVSPQSWAGLTYDIGSLADDGSWLPWQAPEGSVLDFSDGHLFLSVAVPEAGTPAMLLAGLAAVGWRRRLLRPGRRGAPLVGPGALPRRRLAEAACTVLLSATAGGAQAVSADSACLILVAGLQPCLEARSSALGSATVRWDDGRPDSVLAAPSPTMQLVFGADNSVTGTGSSLYGMPGGLGAQAGGLGPSLKVDFARTTGVQGAVPTTDRHYTVGHTNSNFLHGGAAADSSITLNSRATSDFAFNRAAIDFQGIDLQPFALDAANRLQPGSTGQVSQRVFGSAQSIWADRVTFSTADEVQFDIQLEGTLAGAASSIWYVLSATDAEGHTQNLLNSFTVGSAGSAPLNLQLSGVLHAAAGVSYALVGELYAFINVTDATAGPDGAVFSAASSFYNTARITRMAVAVGDTANFGSGAAVWASITQPAAAVPEPGAVWLMLAGLLALAAGVCKRPAIRRSHLLFHHRAPPLPHELPMDGRGANLRHGTDGTF